MEVIDDWQSTVIFITLIIFNSLVFLLFIRSLLKIYVSLLSNLLFTASGNEFIPKILCRSAYCDADEYFSCVFSHIVMQMNTFHVYSVILWCRWILFMCIQSYCDADEYFSCVFSHIVMQMNTFHVYSVV